MSLEAEERFFYALYLRYDWSDEIPPTEVFGPYNPYGRSKARINWMGAVPQTADGVENSLLKWRYSLFKKYQGETKMGEGRLSTPKDIERANELLDFVIASCVLNL